MRLPGLSIRRGILCLEQLRLMLKVDIVYAFEEMSHNSLDLQKMKHIDRIL